jgi:hypothetical protein
MLEQLWAAMLICLRNERGSSSRETFRRGFVGMEKGRHLKQSNSAVFVATSDSVACSKATREKQRSSSRPTQSGNIYQLISPFKLRADR